MQQVIIHPEALPQPEPIARAREAGTARAPWRPSPFAAAEALPVDVRSLAVEVVRAPDVLMALEPQWQALADAAVEPNPFYEPWMVLPALRHLDGPRPHFAFIWGRDAATNTGRVLCGVIPFVVERRRRVALWRYPHCDLSAPLLRPGVPRETLSAFFAWLEQGQGRLLRLDQIPAEGPFSQALLDVVRHRGWSAWQAEAHTRAVFRPAPTAEQFLETAVSARRRKDWRRLSVRLTQAAGNVEVEELDSVDALRLWTDAFLRLEATGWKGRAGVGFASRERDRRYFEELCRHAALRGRLQLLALKAAGQPIAMKLNLFTGSGAGFAFQIAYDEAWAKFSPGVLLELENIHRLHAMPTVRWMDSCAEKDPFMINHLWPERRQLQTLHLAAPGRWSAMTLALVPLLRWARSLRQRAPADAVAPVERLVPDSTDSRQRPAAQTKLSA